jgi:myo-inositol-1-phosphate synthase
MAGFTSQDGMISSHHVPSHLTDSITRSLITRSQQTGACIAGRDGSTGQTILKLLFRDFLQDRGLSILSWYSTNLIGNRDGLVLDNPEYNETKIRDKLSVLPEPLLTSSSRHTHLVDIRYFPPAGDDKEAWDCVYFRGWLDRKMSLRVNWHGSDSYLAAPLILDIVSGLIKAHKLGRRGGVVSELSLFFKAPIASDGDRFYEQLHLFQQLATQEVQQ